MRIPLFLIGFMGAGKTTIGREVASRLGCEFVDLDIFIEQRFRQTVAEIFATEGEERFRELERNVLIEVSDFQHVVVSTGGGLPCYFNNMELMNRKGVTLFIDPNEGQLLVRLLRGRAKRPLLQGKSDEELRRFIVDKRAERLPFYRQAKIVISNQDDKETIIEQIIAQVNHAKEI